MHTPHAHRASLRPGPILSRRHLLALGGMALIGAACAPSTSTTTPMPKSPSAAAAAPTAAKPTAPPPAEITIYTTRAEALFKPVIDAFTAAHPSIKATVLTGTDATLGTRLIEEKANPRADVYINADTLAAIDLSEKGLFAPNPSRTVGAVAEAYRETDGRWVSLTLRARTIMFNTNLVKPEERPASVFDLIDPKWKGQIGAADSRNGAMLASLVAIGALQGDAKTEEFVKGLVANQTKWFSGHTDVRKAVGNGEFKLGFVNHYYYHLSKAEGAPVGIIYPDQAAGQMGLMVNSTNASLVAGSKFVEQAAVFVDYMLGSEGQKIFAERNYEYPIVSGVPLAEGVAPLSQYRLASITLRKLWEGLAATRALALRSGLP